MFKFNEKISFIIVLILGTILISLDYYVVKFFYNLTGTINNEYLALLTNSISGIIALLESTVIYFILSKKYITILKGVILAFLFVIVKILQMYLYAHITNSYKNELTEAIIVTFSFVYAYWIVIVLLIVIVIPNLILKLKKSRS